MSREIKFRAWDKKTNGMLRLVDTPVWQLNPYLSTFPWVIMQFTGVSDCNGTEIWEGDIVKTKIGKIRQIVYENGGFFSRIKPGDRSEGHALYFWAVCPDFLPEVVGNIYQNPELLDK